MDKKKKEMILVAVLALVMGYIVYSSFLAPKPKKPSSPAPAPVPEEKAPAPLSRRHPAADSTAGPAEVVELPPVDEKLIRMQLARSKEPWGRDPFNPPPTPAVVEQPGLEWRGFRVTGIIPGPAGGTAIINGEVVGKGEMFRGYLLRKVEINKITLEKDGQGFIITMPEK